MKRNMVMGIAIALGMLSTGAVSASAAIAAEGACFDKASEQQYRQETAALADAVRVKEMQLSELLGYDSRIIEARQLETEIKELKDRIGVAAKKHDIRDCCHD